MDRCSKCGALLAFVADLCAMCGEEFCVRCFGGDLFRCAECTPGWKILRAGRATGSPPRLLTIAEEVSEYD